MAKKDLRINKKKHKGRVSQTKQPGLVPMYVIKEVDAKKVKYIKYWYEPPGTFKGKYA